MSTTKKTNQVNKPMIIPGPKLHVARNTYAHKMLERAAKEQEQRRQEREEDKTID